MSSMDFDEKSFPFISEMAGPKVNPYFFFSLISLFNMSLTLIPEEFWQEHGIR